MQAGGAQSAARWRAVLSVHRQPPGHVGPRTSYRTTTVIFIFGWIVQTSW